VLALVTAGNLLQLVVAWIATSLFLHQLLLFYPDRVAARRAARKKFVTARLGDLALLGAAGLLLAAYGTGDIGAILSAARAGQGGSLAGGAAVLLAVAAIFKSAQFPTHGWLTEVMETPTPVSALLHAGVINAGGFLFVAYRAPRHFPLWHCSLRPQGQRFCGLRAVLPHVWIYRPENAGSLDYVRCWPKVIGSRWGFEMAAGLPCPDREHSPARAERTRPCHIPGVERFRERFFASLSSRCAWLPCGDTSRRPRCGSGSPWSPRVSARQPRWRSQSRA